MIAPDDQQVLARRAVPAGRIVVDAAVAHVHAIDDGIAYRRATLDNSPAHDGNMASETLETSERRRARWLASKSELGL
jgi:hypothetical protein